METWIGLPGLLVAVLIGVITPGKIPVTYKGQNIFNMTLLAATIGCFVYLLIVPTAAPFFYVMVGLAFVYDRYAGHTGLEISAEGWKLVK